MTPYRNDDAELSAAIDELSAEFCRKPAEERAFIMLRNYFAMPADAGTHDRRALDEIDNRLWAWFRDPCNCQAKDAAMLRVIEMFDA